MANVFERTEKKYILSAEKRRIIENELKSRMTPDAHGESTIRNIYYDTSDFRLARRSLEKPMYKEKLRVRSYTKVSGDDEVFVELKKKYKGVVYKRRFTMPEQKVESFLSGSGTDTDNDQIKNEIAYFCAMYAHIRPQVFLSYDRRAYFGIDDKELRISFDTNIRWRTTNLSLTEEPYGRGILKPGTSIMEIKAPGAMPLWLVDLLNRTETRPGSFSKYGTAYQTMLIEGSLDYMKHLSPGRIPAGSINRKKEAAAYA